MVMRAKPGEIAKTVAAKTNHPLAGANCAWVPSPTAATLHTTLCHQIGVLGRQREVAKQELASLDYALTIQV